MFCGPGIRKPSVLRLADPFRLRFRFDSAQRRVGRLFVRYVGGISILSGAPASFANKIVFAPRPLSLFQKARSASNLLFRFNALIFLKITVFFFRMPDFQRKTFPKQQFSRASPDTGQRARGGGESDVATPESRKRQAFFLTFLRQHVACANPESSQHTIGDGESKSQTPNRANGRRFP